jgi:hypothetical protein
MNEVHVINKSLPISISIKRQYNLKLGNFDPLQNSPPSIWKERLAKRINKTN